MKHANGWRMVLLMIVAGTLHQGCFGGEGSNSQCNSTENGGSDFFGSCPVPQKPQECRGTDGEGRVRITAEQAWPDRVGEPPRLTAEETANGCAAYVACLDEDDEFSAVGGHTLFAFLFHTCLNGAWFLSTEREERAIPWSGNERFSFFIREILAARGDCAAIRSIATERPSWIYCEEDGCFARERHEVTCEGDVAVFDDGSRRDCSRAFATCSTSSETGCTDRPFTGCKKGAKARCDGDVRLGCDGCGYVSFHDCGWNGGHCEETEKGTGCVAPDTSACEGVQSGCADGGFERCVFGHKVRVDCAAIGMECVDQNAVASSSGTYELCAAEGLPPACVLGNCRARPDAGAP
jgi:hypothetical protein